jgi:peptidoglycan hydrolase CwlO-like protein
MKVGNFKKKLLLSAFLLLISSIFLGLDNFSSAQYTKEPAKERRALQQELEELEKLIIQYEKDISKTEKEKRSLENKIASLKKEIKKLDLQIQQSNIMIKDLGFQIKDTEVSIEKTSLKIGDLKEKLAQLLRTIYEEEQKSLIEILLSEENLSGFFNNLMALENLSSQNRELLENIKGLKTTLEAQKRSLDEEKRNLERIIKVQTLQKIESENVKKEQDYFLKLAEAEYQTYLKEKQELEKRAAEIRARIFKLIGVRKAPSYEKAVEIAKQVSEITGVRAAFLLGILTQESRIGKYVGQCYLQDPSTGMGIKFRTNRKWPRVMKPDWVPLFFKTIEQLNKEKKLKLDPFATPISCWIAACVNKNYQVTYNVSVNSQGEITCPSGYIPFGWGGAMGPAQLMPFNWIGSDNYKYRIEKITNRIADPWDFSDAVLGAALHLQDCRADLSEREAAACYFGGWGNRKNPYHLINYADHVIALTKCHQDFINKGTMSSWCETRIF